jgi:hypothetical protein
LFSDLILAGCRVFSVSSNYYKKSSKNFSTLIPLLFHHL